MERFFVMGNTLYRSMTVFILFFTISCNLFAADEIEILQFGSQQKIDAIDENSPMGLKLGYLRINGAVTDLSNSYTVAVSPSGDFSLLDSTHADDGKKRLYLVTQKSHDYEVDAHSFDIQISATDNATDASYQLDHSITLLPQNDSAATCKSINGLPIKENTSLFIDIATMLLDTNGVLWKDFSQYKVADSDMPADSNHWWIGEVISPKHGTLVTTKKGTFQYDFPSQGNEAVADTFYYTLYDSASYEETTNQQQFMFSIKFKNISDEAPVALPDTIVVDEAQTQTVLHSGGSSLLLNDSDLDNSLDYDGDGIPDTLDFHTVSLLPTDSTQVGTILLKSDGTFSYEHDGSNTFADAFSYIIDDGTYTDTAKVTIIINPLNTNPPVIQADTLVLSEGATAAVLMSGITNLLSLATDADLPHDTLLITPANSIATACGTISILADGSFSYMHNGSEIFSDAFQFTITDEAGHTTNSTIPVSITPVSDIAPVAVADAIVVIEGSTTTTLTGGATSLLSNDSDVENDISGLLVTVEPVNGTLTYNQTTGSFSYAHNGSETVTDSFFYYATDGVNNSAPVKVSIAITPNLTVATPLPTALYNAGCLLDASGTVSLSGSTISVTGPLSGISGTTTAIGTTWSLNLQPLSSYEGPDTLMVVSMTAGTIADTVLIPITFGRAAKPFGYSIISVNDPVTFTDSTSTLFAGSTTHHWDFGDGTTSNLKDPSHLYAQPGVYTVTEIITYYSGCSDTLRAAISVFNNISPTTENYFLDTNADGMMDRISLSFPAPISVSSLSGISFHFTWLGANGTVVTLSPTTNQWIFPTATAQTIYFDVPLGATADNVTSLGAGYGTGQLVSGDRLESIIMKDGMAPVITYARIPETLPNTLLISYSEAVAQPSVSPQPFDLIESATNLPYGATLSQIDAVNLDRVYTITALTNAFRIKLDDRISIHPAAFISDLAGNIQDNPLNDKVPVLVPVTKLTCEIRGFSLVAPTQHPLAPVSANLLHPAPAQLTTGTAFDIHLNYPIENHNIGIKFVVMDVVGNVVCSIDKVGIYEDELFVTSSANSAQLLRVLWSGRNLQSRVVGSGSYIAIATVTDLSTGSSAQATTVIKVLQ